MHCGRKQEALGGVIVQHPFAEPGAQLDEVVPAYNQQEGEQDHGLAPWPSQASDQSGYYAAGEDVPHVTPQQSVRCYALARFRLLPLPSLPPQPPA